MKRRILVLVALGSTVVATCFATAAWATTAVSYPPGINHMVWAAGSSERSGFTGLGWTDNFASWEKPFGGSPSMCLSYVDTNETLLMSLACTNTLVNIDSRNSSSYSAAYCSANASNSNKLLMAGSNGDGCLGHHN
jgi:hypothetical protein